jgi:hypothetical protein
MCGFCGYGNAAAYLPASLCQTHVMDPVSSLCCQQWYGQQWYGQLMVIEGVKAGCTKLGYSYAQSLPTLTSASSPRRLVQL